MKGIYDMEPGWFPPRHCFVTPELGKTDEAKARLEERP